MKLKIDRLIEKDLYDKQKFKLSKEILQKFLEGSLLVLRLNLIVAV